VRNRPTPRTTQQASVCCRLGKFCLLNNEIQALAWGQVLYCYVRATKSKGVARTHNNVRYAHSRPDPEGGASRAANVGATPRGCPSDARRAGAEALPYTGAVVMRAKLATAVCLALTLITTPLITLAQFPVAPEGEKQYPPPKDKEKEVEQRRPGYRPDNPPMKWLPPKNLPDQIAGPGPLLKRDVLHVPDRWRLMQALGVKFPWYDPYNPNFLKGDYPIDHPKWVERFGTDWFVNLSAVSDTLVELRQLPTPVAPQTSTRANSLDIFGRRPSQTFAQSLIFSASLIKGNTTFKPPDYEFRIAPVLNVNYSRASEDRALRIDPRTGKTRADRHLAIQEAFADVHLQNVSDRYDFDSYRIGIQPFISDFRGFVFQDVPFGARLFGIRDNNQWQYNLGWFRRLEKDTNSGLNDIGVRPRRDDTFVANLFRQDFPVLGHTTQATIMHNINRENRGEYYNRNGFLERPAALGDQRPHKYNVTYLGLSGDGHFGRTNVTSSFYLALGRDDRHPLPGRPQRIQAGMAAVEVSRDFSWVRARMSAMLASGDQNPFDDKATGFDAILENPQFAGSDTSFYIRQAVPLIGGGGVALSGRNGILPSLRSSKDQGQSNFINPGLALLGAGADVDVTPNLRVIGNANQLWFMNTGVLGVLRNQAPPSKYMGLDISTAVQYRPFMNQNVVLNASAAALLPGKGLKALYDEKAKRTQYSVLANLIFTF
jgi:hypothetical protein